MYESVVSKPTIKKIINGNPNNKIKLCTFHLKYPQNKHLLTLMLHVQPNGYWKTGRGFACDFQIHFQCTTFPVAIASAISINYIIYSKELNIDSWSTNRFGVSQKIGYPMIHKSFQMNQFKQWMVNNKSSNKNGIVFGLIIKNIQLIHPKYSHPNLSKIITLSTFNPNKRYYKFTWNINRETILKFKTYKISQWFRSNIKGKQWYFVLYPMGDLEIEYAKPDCVQFAMDLVTTPSYIYGIHVYYHAVLMETYTHFHRLNCYFEPEEKTYSQAAVSGNTLTCKDLLKLNSITFQIEIYVFRPIKLIDRKEMFVNYWDIHADKYKIKSNPPNRNKMKGNI
eukprot:294684_1